MSYYYNDTPERVEYHGKVIHTVEIDMEPSPVRLRYEDGAAAYNVLSCLQDNKPLGVRGAACITETEDGRPLYEE